MVAYNFQKQFVEPIKAGTKSHTIRKNGKRSHARIGDRPQIYTGMRTKGCQKILKHDPVCCAVISIEIDVTSEGIQGIYLGGEPVDDLEDFARQDGFESLAAMHAFWLDFHGVGCFSGTFIGWEQ